MTPTKEQIEKVAEWWAFKTFDVPLNQNNGDNSEMGGMAFMLMNTVAMKAKSTEATVETREKFKQSIISQLERDPNTYLDVDYHPSDALVTACREAGVSTSFIPIKTFTVWRKYRSVFEGRFQYGGRFETIA